MRIAAVLAGFTLGAVRRAAQGHGQEGPQGHGQAARGLPRRHQGQGHHREEGHQDLRADGVLRRLRLQQVALDGLRVPGLPDRLSQGELPAPLRRRAADHRGRQHRQAGALHHRVARARHRGAAARHQREPAAVHVSCPRACASASPPSRASAKARSRRSSRSGRAPGRITSLHQLAEELDLRIANRRVFEALVKSGACDTLAAAARRPRRLAAGRRPRPAAARHRRRASSTARGRSATATRARPTSSATARRRPEAPGRRAARGAAVDRDGVAGIREGGARPLPERPSRSTATPPTCARSARAPSATSCWHRGDAEARTAAPARLRARRRLGRRHRQRQCAPSRPRRATRWRCSRSRIAQGAVEVVVFPETYGAVPSSHRDRRHAAGARQVRARRRLVALPGGRAVAARDAARAAGQGREHPPERRGGLAGHARGAVGPAGQHQGDRPIVLEMEVASGTRAGCGSAPTSPPQIRVKPSEQLVDRRRTAVRRRLGCAAIDRDRMRRPARVRRTDRRPAEGDRGAVDAALDRRPAARHRPGCSDRITSIRADLYAGLTPWQRVLVARHPARPDDARLRRAAVHRLRRDPRRPALRRRPRDRDRARRCSTARRCWSSATRRAATPSRRSTATSATPGPRATARRCARCSWPRSSRRPVIVLRRHAGGLSRHRVGGARRRRGDRPQPARDGGARRADHRRRARRGRQRRRARHRRRRPHPDAGVRDLQRHPAGGLRRDPVARLQPQGARRPRR